MIFKCFTLLGCDQWAPASLPSVSLRSKIAKTVIVFVFRNKRADCMTGQEMFAKTSPEHAKYNTIGV